MSKKSRKNMGGHRDAKRTKAAGDAPASPDRPVESWWQDRRSLFWLGMILATTLVCYWPAIHSEFVNWDDHLYVISNPYVTTLSASNLAAMFTQPMVTRLGREGSSMVCMRGPPRALARQRG